MILIYKLFLNLINTNKPKILYFKGTTNQAIIYF